MIINGPNLNLLGLREPEIYGYDTLADISILCEEEARKFELEIDFRQTNSEGEIINWIHETKFNDSEGFAGIIINAGAYTHTSIAIMDAIFSADIPTIEVHLTNIYKREDFRHKSYLAKACKGVICGFGANSYALAIAAIAKEIESV